MDPSASRLSAFGAVLQAVGDLAGARPYYERALAIFEEVLGPDHPNTVMVRGNLESWVGEEAVNRFWERIERIWWERGSRKGGTVASL